jgi:sporulation protein YtfJ
VEKLLDTSIQKIKTLMDSNTIIGDTVISPSGLIIIPISKITVGFITGGGEYSDLSERRVANHYPMAGGSSGGMSVTPIGFLVETENEVKYIDIENKNTYQTILKLFNSLAEKISGEGE